MWFTRLSGRTDLLTDGQTRKQNVSGTKGFRRRKHKMKFYLQL